MLPAQDPEQASAKALETLNPPHSRVSAPAEALAHAAQQLAALGQRQRLLLAATRGAICHDLVQQLAAHRGQLAQLGQLDDLRG